MSDNDKRYAVYGTGRLPLDMLRYDSAWPATEIDANRADAQDWDSGAKIIIMQGKREPTERRWESFGWSVEVHRD